MCVKLTLLIVPIMHEDRKDFSAPKLILDVMMDVIIVFLMVVFIRSFLFAPFRIHGPSMCNTFNIYDDVCINSNGEHILTSKLSVWNLFGWNPTKIQRGDVVVFEDPSESSDKHLIKRVIGLPGETVHLRDGLVFVETDGEEFELQEDYLNEDNKNNTQAFRSNTASFTVPENEYFVMGDNRGKSSDSRRCFAATGCNESNSAFVPHKELKGEVRLVIYPFSHFRWVPGGSYEESI